ncbi:MAG: DUF87 domain-containing protein [Clostridia bacterium]|nr:DUF87 domain-containing protein [Clostridia bacterium]
MEEERKSGISVSTKRQMGITMIVISCVLLVFSIFNILSDVRAFLLGVFGLMIFPILLFSLFFGVALTLGKRFVYTFRYTIYIMLVFFFFVCVLHIIFTGFGSRELSYGEYLLSCYHSLYTPGGLFVGLFTFPLMSLLHDMAGVIIYAIAFVIALYFVFSYLDMLKQKRTQKVPYKKYENFVDEELQFFPKKEIVTEKVEQETQIPKINTAEDDIFIKDTAEKSKEVDVAKKKLGLSKEQDVENFEEEEKSTPKSRLFGNKVDDNNENWSNRAVSSNRPQKFVYDDQKIDKKPNPIIDENRKYMNIIQDKNNVNENPIINAENYDDYKEKMKLFEQKHLHAVSRFDEPSLNKISEPDDEISDTNSFGIEPEKDFIADEFDIEDDFIKPNENVRKMSPLNPVNFSVNDKTDDEDENASERFVKEKDFNDENFEDSDILSAKNMSQRKFNYDVLGGGSEKQKVEEPDFRYDSNYISPSFELLKTYKNEEDFETDHAKNIEALEKVLEEFRIPAKVENVCRGAAVTRYEMHMPVGIPVKKIQMHSSDIALALAAKSDIRIEAPIKGKSAVGIEVPNNKVDIVGLKDIIRSDKFMEAKSPLTFALGKDVDGTVYCCNLAKMPHLLVAGSTGSGKSVCLNALILSLIFRTSPEDLRLILVDPKRVEFAVYNNLPHLLMPKVITEPKKALNAFDWLINEMERRFMVFQACFVKSINEYNMQSDVLNKRKPKLPYIVLIVDELADLVITTNKKDLEEKIIRLTQKARAAGIHIILATQRPTVDVITGSIKINLPTRIAFAVTNFMDSKTILDQGGAEKLLGRGDMLYAPSDGEPVRVQGAFVDTPEVRAVVDFIKENNSLSYDDNVEKNINSENGAKNFDGSYGGNLQTADSIMSDALKHVIEVGQASTSMLQRRFGLGFQRAAKIIDQMERAGFISSSDGSKPRAVYMTMEDYNKYYGLK